MASIRTDTDDRGNPTLSYLRYTDATSTSRSIALGGQSPENLALFRRIWDEALALGRATQGRKKGKPVPKAEDEPLSVQEAIDSFLTALEASKAARSTKANTRSQINQLRRGLGPRWEGWMTGYWKHLDRIANTNTRNCRKRAANLFRDHHLDAIPDFTKKTRVNRPEKKYVSQRGGPSGASKKTYDHPEAVALLSHLDSLDEFMQLQELVGVYMGMSPEDARNFLLCRTPDGAESTRHDWDAGTYFGRRQKTGTYYEDVPIPQILIDRLRPHVRGHRLRLPFAFPGHPEKYRELHRDLEDAAGVRRIKRRNLNGWRHHFSTTLEVDLKVPRVIVKALMAQHTKQGERQDIADIYKHAWPDLLRDASRRFEEFMTGLLQAGQQVTA